MANSAISTKNKANFNKKNRRIEPIMIGLFATFTMMAYHRYAPNVIKLASSDNFVDRKKLHIFRVLCSFHTVTEQCVCPCIL